MRHIIPLLGLTLFTITCNSQTDSIPEKPKNDLIEKGLKGKVKTLTETTYEIVEKFGETQKGGMQQKSVYRYNSIGYETDFASYEPGSNQPSTKNTTKYDEKGNKIAVSMYDYTGTAIINYKYDSKGNLIEESQPNFSKKVYKYNEQNKLIEKSEFKKYIKGYQLESKDIMKYDEMDNQIEYAVYNSDGSLNQKFLSKYDANKNLIEKRFLSTGGQSDWRVVNKYNEKSNVIEYSSYNSKGILTDYSTTNYNENGTISESTRSYSYDSNPNVKFKEFYRYDGNGYQIEYSTGSSSTTYKYEFDKSGNWIKKTEYQNGKPNSLIERVIEYY